MERLLYAECDGIKESGQERNRSVVRVLYRYDVLKQMDGVASVYIYLPVEGK